MSAIPIQTIPADKGSRRHSSRTKFLAAAFAGLVLTLGLLAATLALVRQALEASVIDATQSANASITQAFINENWARVRVLLPTGDGWTPAEVRASANNREIDSLVRAFSKGTDVLKVKIYNVAGKVLYSSDPAQIGDDASANRYFRAAVEGKFQSQLTFRGRFDGMEGHVFDRDLISSYIPVRLEGKIDGVAELYADRTPSIAQFRDALLKLSFVLAPIFLGLYGVIIALAIRHERLRDQKQAQLEELAMREERANRAKTEFLAHMSHELRTPLNAILGYAQLMDAEFGSGNASAGDRLAIREHTDRIMAAGWHLLGLIEEVLDLTKIEAGAANLELDSVALPGLLDHCLTQLDGLAAGAKVKLRAPIVEHGAEWVTADPVKLRQVLLNLLSNAIKYNVEGGEVEAIARPSAEGVRIEVRDTGRGMSADQLARLFQPFTRFVGRSEVIQGSGIGLALSKRLVEAMNGSLVVTSELAKGSVFSVNLPAAEPAPPAADAARESAAVSPKPKAPVAPEPVLAGGRPLRVLYVEDASTNFEVVRMYLARRGGYEIFGAEDGEQGLEVARRERPDVILLDMNLPGIDGMTVKARLSEDDRTAAIPVIALSAGALKTDIDEALKAGFVEYLTKPLRLPRLTETLSRVASGLDVPAGERAG